MAARGAIASRRPHGRDAMIIDDGVSADAVWNDSSSSSPRARRSMVESMSLRKSDPAPRMLMPSVRKADKMIARSGRPSRGARASASGLI